MPVLAPVFADSEGQPGLRATIYSGRKCGREERTGLVTSPSPQTRLSIALHIEPSDNVCGMSKQMGRSTFLILKAVFKVIKVLLITLGHEGIR